MSMEECKFLADCPSRLTFICIVCLCHKTKMKDTAGKSTKGFPAKHRPEKRGNSPKSLCQSRYIGWSPVFKVSAHTIFPYFDNLQKTNLEDFYHFLATYGAYNIFGPPSCTLNIVG